MNCAECRDNLVASLEGLLEADAAQACQAHLESCSACRAEYAAYSHLQQQLFTHGRVAGEISLVVPVMRQVRQAQVKPERKTIMSRLYSRWGFGLTAAAGAAAIVVLGLLVAPKARATAADVMARGARAMANLTSVHLQGKLRTLPNDNFSYIDPKCDFCNIEIWKQFEPQLKWRVDKPGRLVAMDGQSTIHFLRPANYAIKVGPSRSAFDTDWLHRIANLSGTITDELKSARANGWGLKLQEEQAADGHTKAVVTVEAKSGLPEGDYLKNKFFDDADTRRVYRFDTQTERLEGVQIFLASPAGEVLIFELTSILYDQPIDAAVFQVALPADVRWHQEMQQLPDNGKYVSMTAEQAARAFFEACARADWTEVGKFWQLPVDASLQKYLGGLEIVSLGKTFGSAGYPGSFVPYEIKLQDGNVKKHNLALKKDGKTGRWFVDGGI